MDVTHQQRKSIPSGQPLSPTLDLRSLLPWQLPPSGSFLQATSHLTNPLAGESLQLHMPSQPQLLWGTGAL